MKAGTVAEWGRHLGPKLEFDNNPGRYLREFTMKPIVQDIALYVEDTLKDHDLLDERSVTQTSLLALETMWHAEQQELHFDFPDELRELSRKCIPLAVVWAVNAAFELVSSKGPIHVPRHHLIVFRADFLHAGSAGKRYSSAWRVHAYVQTSEKMLQKSEFTYIPK